MITGDVKLNNQWADLYRQGGWDDSGRVVYYLPFLALISVNLGIINLFPLPVLDGALAFLS
ncbi:site-2 protease family protein [Escherichia coli]